jgi:hypothetical protein
MPRPVIPSIVIHGLLAVATLMILVIVVVYLVLQCLLGVGDPLVKCDPSNPIPDCCCERCRFNRAERPPNW